MKAFGLPKNEQEFIHTYNKKGRYITSTFRRGEFFQRNILDIGTQNSTPQFLVLKLLISLTMTIHI